jgi:4-amino-4-deoxy-L-arabinose transferase-like glycosyltransferase
MLSNPIKPKPKKGVFEGRQFLLLMTLLFIFTLATAIRVNYLAGSPILGERQYRSALIARAYYFETEESVPQWRKEAALASRERSGLVEPPILEFLVALIYRLVKGEHLWVARLLSSTFWIVGGIFLYLIAKRIVSSDAAVFVTAYYLFVPLGLVVSISFLPEPFMVMMFLISLFAILKFYEEPSLPRLIFAGGISGLAILVKPFCLFAILGAFISLAIYKGKSWKCLFNFDSLVFLGVSISLGASYYIYGIFFDKFLAGNFQTSFFPYLYFKRTFWKGWLLTGAHAVGYSPLVLSPIGFLMLREGFSRVLLIGLCFGYIAFGLIYTFPTPISGHYHLQLIIIVSLALGPVISLIINNLVRISNKWYFWIPVVCALIILFLLNMQVLKSRLAGYNKYEEPEIAQEIGKIVKHSTKTAYLASYYGMPLEYYGELSGTFWPRRLVNLDYIKLKMKTTQNKDERYWPGGIIDWLFRWKEERELSIEERLNTIDFIPEYFIITYFREFNRHHNDLKKYLERNCVLIAKSDKYLIYGSCSK